MSENAQENKSNLIPAMHVLNAVLNDGQSADLLEAQTERQKGQSQLTTQECARLKREIDSGIEKDKEKKKLTPENREKLLALSASLRPTSEKALDSVKETGTNALNLAKEQAEFFTNPQVSAQEKFVRGGMLAAGAAGALWLAKKFVDMGEKPSVFGKIVRGLGLAAAGTWLMNRLAPKSGETKSEKPKSVKYQIGRKEVSEQEFVQELEKFPKVKKAFLERKIIPSESPTLSATYTVQLDGKTLTQEQFEKQFEGALWYEEHTKPASESGAGVPPNATKGVQGAPSATATPAPTNAPKATVKATPGQPGPFDASQLRKGDGTTEMSATAAL